MSELTITNVSFLVYVILAIMSFLVYRVHTNIPKYYEQFKIFTIIAIIGLLLVAGFLIKKGIKK